MDALTSSSSGSSCLRFGGSYGACVSDDVGGGLAPVCLCDADVSSSLLKILKELCV